MDEIEIPEAIRENTDLPRKSSTFLLPLITGIILCVALVGAALAWLFIPQNQTAKTTDNPQVEPVSPQPKIQTAPSKQPESSVVQQNLAKQIPNQPSQGDLLGHLPYEIAPQSELEAITAEGNLKMRSAAAKKFRQMQADARADGIQLIPISAFRTTEAQEQLFFGIKEQLEQDAAKRAEVSAPPGYSEHHTGYAIDIGDGDAPATHLEVEFAETAAFRWLEQNALRYSFELSFPPNNKQGVSYEPWHWRFVGDRHSLETFYKVEE
ncbi:D-alanyl-D-alanine carboxypeptidase family protein [Pleurocapsales cyanobacterium LEGE 10410]|nr:D-alanyl-D-alanine carboxypeptidase family protein [Pleurocapsales cyanobacterium LEGE 10410]